MNKRKVSSFRFAWRIFFGRKARYYLPMFRIYSAIGIKVNIDSNGFSKTCAIRKASSRLGGKYFPFSMATMVWRETPVLSASSCWVISSAKKRKVRILLVINGLLILNSFPVKIELSKIVCHSCCKSRSNKHYKHQPGLQSKSHKPPHG